MEIKCLDFGFVRLVDSMGNDASICQAARVSYGDGTKSVTEDRGLIRYLMRHRHSSPFEMVEFKFHCKMPIFVARQWVRHRMASINEVSARYSVMKDEFFIPEIEGIRKQSKNNKQASDEPVSEDIATRFYGRTAEIAIDSYKEYQESINDGIGRELARINLPVSIYTEWYWKIDLKNLLDFLALRADSHAQKEIQVYANALIKLISPIVPQSIEAWEDYNPLRGAVLFSKLECEALRAVLECTSLKDVKLTGRERTEFFEKMKSKINYEVYDDHG